MAALEALPVEMVENIVTNLDLCDIASLRLTCRTIEAKTSGLSFSTFFSHKNIDLTATALQNFVDVTRQGRLGCLLQDCTLTGIASNETTSADETAEHVRLLADAFRNLKHRSPRGGLASLTLNLAARVGPGGEELAPPDDRRVSRAWRTVWDAATRTFRVVMAALDGSQMSVGESLDVFGSVAGCSLACDVFVASAGVFSSTHVFGSLKRLTLSLSAPYLAESEQELELRKSAGGTLTFVTKAQARHSQQISQAVMQLRHATRALEGLDLHWYDLGTYTSSIVPDSPEENSVATNSDTMHMRSCSLRGVFVSETNLLDFLQTTSPEDLTLRDVSIVSGKVDSILDFLNGQDSPVKSYHLSDLLQGRLVHFNVPGRSNIPYAHVNGRLGPSTLTRRAGDAKEAVSYSQPTSRPLGSPGLYSWRRYKKQEYGPPRCHGFGHIGQKDSWE